MITPSDSENEDIDGVVSGEELDFEPEDELGTVGAVKAKMAKLRDELKEAKQKRDEYLDGWQRSKADMVNSKRDAGEALQRSRSLAREGIIEELIPALDSFDMAMQSDAWHSVDSAWRSGVEGIRTQIERVLVDNGIEIFGTEGEVFNPMEHEAIQEASGGDAHTIAKVLRKGYKTKERVLRPAQVAVFTA